MVANAATYYVALNGNNANAGFLQNPWRTIDYAADRVSPGDTVIVGPGHYGETVTPNVSGTSGRPITFYGAKLATNTAWSISGRNYIRVVGFVVDRAGGQDCISLSNCNYIEIWDSIFRGCTRQSIGQDTGGKGSIGNNCIFSGNYFIGGAESRFFQIRGTNNLVEYNIGDSQNEDFIYWFGQGNIIRNNYAFNPNRNSAGHVDFFQTGDDSGVGNNFTTVEYNLYIDSDIPASHHHFSNIENAGSTSFSHTLLRRNVSHQNGTYVHNIFNNVINTYLVHETYVGANRLAGQASANYGIWIQNRNARIFNSIAWNLWGDNVATPEVWVLDGTGAAHDYNLGFDPDRSVTFVGAFGAEANSLKNVNPGFVDYANDLFYPAASSRCIGAAGALTQTVGTGSGRTFSVSDAGFFRGDVLSLDQYGGQLIVGDTITVGSDVVVIERIVGNDITVSTDFSWVDGDRVYWGNDITPDIGAYPYTSGGFDFNVDIVSHSDGQAVSGPQVIEARVNNTNAVRHIVFFVDGLPVAADNASPYTFLLDDAALSLAKQQSIEARAYSLYPSKRLTASDTVRLNADSATRPAPPANLRIIGSD